MEKIIFLPKKLNLPVPQAKAQVVVKRKESSAKKISIRVSDHQVPHDLSKIRIVTQPNNVPNEVIDLKKSLSENQTITARHRQEIMAMVKAEEEKIDCVSVDLIRLSLFSPDELKRMAVCECNLPEISGIGSCNDARLGTQDDDKICASCFQSWNDCPGHYGVVTLRRSFIHPLFNRMAIWVLQCVCNSCSGLLVTKEFMEQRRLFDYKGTNRLQKLAEICEKLRCTRYVSESTKESAGIRTCIINPTYHVAKMKDNYIVTYEYTKPKRFQSERTIEDIIQIFKYISDEDAELMGFSNGMHPSRMILNALPVIPPCARPQVFAEGEIKIDYLTTAYCDIIRHNNMLESLDPRKDEKKYRDTVRNLYFFISHFIDNTDGRYTRSQDEPILSIKERLIRKEGFIRNMMMGKRVNYCARTVVGPCSAIVFGEIALPEIFRKTLTVPEVVTKYNLDEITKMYEEGKITHLIPGSGALKEHRYEVSDKVRLNMKPKVGDRVERWSRDGDVILFNRQPSLHRQSMMGHRVRYFTGEVNKGEGSLENIGYYIRSRGLGVIPSKRKNAFRYVWIPTMNAGVHMSYTAAYNADFDGDEMNIHMPQTHEARVEAYTIASVDACIMSAQSNRPIMSVVYNGLSSAWMMTQENIIFSEEKWEEAVSLLTSREGLERIEERLRKWKIPLYSGKALFSTLLPVDMYYNKGEVKIRDGILIKGCIHKDHIGASGNSIIHSLWKQYGRCRTSTFLTDCNFLTGWYIQEIGLSVSYSDCIAPNSKEVDKVIHEEMTKAKLHIQSISHDIRKRLNPIKEVDVPYRHEDEQVTLEDEIREKKIRGYLDTVSNIGNKISVKVLSETNSLNIMSRSKAKGNDSNTAQITGILGEQFIRGLRPEQTLTCNTRCLPYFEPNSSEIEARGFCVNSFMKGLNPAEMFFHMTASRIGLTETAVKTADTGHMHHRMIKVLEDMQVDYDGSVRNASKVIFQFAYYDGFDAAELCNTRSSRSGEIVSFIDLRETVGRINSQFGY